MAIRRKIIGWEYSKLVTLPKQWLNFQNLAKGDYICMELGENNTLILRGEKSVKKTTAEY
jgi:hypothetical protein